MPKADIWLKDEIKIAVLENSKDWNVEDVRVEEVPRIGRLVHFVLNRVNYFNLTGK